MTIKKIPKDWPPMITSLLTIVTTLPPITCLGKFCNYWLGGCHQEIVTLLNEELVEGCMKLFDACPYIHGTLLPLFRQN